MNKTQIIEPGHGKQEMFITCPAQGVLYAGGAGSGKTRMLQWESCRYAFDSTYTGILFRRSETSIVGPGGLWETAKPIFRACGAMTTNSSLTAVFPAGGRITMSHLQLERNVDEHQGNEYCFIGFDEIDQFTMKQWQGITARNRARGGSSLTPYWRATCNAVNIDEHWIGQLINWWIGPDGYALEDRAGVVRWYTIQDEKIMWVDKDWRGEYGEAPLSFTFVPAKLDDNPVDQKWRDAYRSQLAAKDKVTRARLLDANWRYSEKGKIFNTDWFVIEEKAPADLKAIRYWDMASTKDDNSDTTQKPSTAGARCGLYKGELWITDIADVMETPGAVEKKMQDVAKEDGHETAIGWEEEKGSSGRYVSRHLHLDVFKGYECHPDPVSGDKVSRALPWAALAEHGYVHLVRGPWIARFKQQAGVFFTKGKKCDQIDAVSGAYKLLFQVKRIWNAYSSVNYSQSDKPIVNFEGCSQKKCCFTINLFGDLRYGVYGIFSMWGRESQRLYVYNELVMPNVVLDSLIEQIEVLAKIPLKATQGPVSVQRIFLNPAMAAPDKDSLRVLMMRKGLFARENNRYDEAGGVMLVNSMFQNGEILIAKHCMETDRQIREWKEKEKGGRPAEGFWLCKALCGCVNDLQGFKEFERPKPIVGYSRIPKEMRNKRPEKIKSNVSPWDM